MKNIRSVFILLVGMASLTAFATTSKLDQKPKTEFQSEKSFQFEAVNVEKDFQVVSVFSDVTFFEIAIVQVSKKEVKPFLAIITDVGWQSEKQDLKAVVYHERMLDNYNLKFKNQFNPDPNMRSSC